MSYIKKKKRANFCECYSSKFVLLVTLSIVHCIENYPLYYDACYFPKIQPENFSNFFFSVGLDIKRIKNPLLVLQFIFSNNSIYKIEELLDDLEIHFAYENVKLPKKEIASSNFTFC